MVTGLGKLDEWTSQLQDGADLVGHGGWHKPGFAAQIPYSARHLGHHVFQYFLVGRRLVIE